MCKIPAMRAGVARQKQAQAFIDASRRCFDAGQSGAIGAEPYAFILVFAEAVGVVIDDGLRRGGTAGGGTDSEHRHRGAKCIP